MPDRLGAACAAFAVDVPKRPAPPGRPAHPERPGAATDGRPWDGSSTGEHHSEQPPGRRPGGCGPLALAVLVVLVAGFVALALILVLGGSPGTTSPRPEPAKVGPRPTATDGNLLSPPS
ncbi:hypothetical protein ACFVVU_03365 [Kitasatospora sp. NPDC057965]|uniref:hypothetical protein n=1 Tax=Kitasatospora sp. NPDC057965 TaxID=3346291 RepID=UPI0036D8BEC8